MHLVFAAHARKASLAAACRRLMHAAEEEGFSCSLLGTEEMPVEPSDAAIVAVGGDGNFIRTAQIACRKQLPLFGVNCGHVGFLTEWTEETFSDALSKLRSGEFTVEERAMLSVSVNDEPMRDCFNDLLVYKRALTADDVKLLTIMAGRTGTDYTYDAVDYVSLDKNPRSSAEGIFDMSGRRVAKGASLPRGIYIVNGRKVAVR